MARVKVAVTDYVEANLDWEAEEFSRRGLDFSFHQLIHEAPQTLIAATRDADIVIVNYTAITAEVVAGWNRCRLVIRHGTGFNNLDTPALARAGIRACYVPDYCIDEVAEHAIALIFACGRRLQDCRTAMEDSVGKPQWALAGLVPVYRMSGRTLGIVGCGRIGSSVYRKLQSLGFRFLICDPYLTAERKKELGIEVVDKEQVFRASDFVTLHTPLNEETRHLVDASALAQMKPTAYLINTARGPVVDIQALAEALQKGVIAGAGIDVYDADPPGRENPLLGLANAVLTPHSAWYSEDSAWNVRQLIMLEVDRFLAGLPPRHPVPR